ncbi:unnamed protein product [Toxocara canis]|uniref:Retrotransposon protein n=1 Tax=Toxocara canis TaxID=6265 RepID=A0A183V985_TOXCA|nr:unnamed protein product [Toxocara canis]
MFDASLQLVFHEVDRQNDGVNFDGNRLSGITKLQPPEENGTRTATIRLPTDTSETKAMSNPELRSRIRVRDEHIKGVSKFLYMEECVKMREATD